MPVIRFIIATLVVIAGLIGAAVLVVFGLVVFVLSRLFGRPAQMPRFQASFRSSRPGAAAGPARRTDPNVIDVVATEVKDPVSLQGPRSNTNR